MKLAAFTALIIIAPFIAARPAEAAAVVARQSGTTTFTCESGIFGRVGNPVCCPTSTVSGTNTDDNRTAGTTANPCFFNPSWLPPNDPFHVAPATGNCLGETGFVGLCCSGTIRETGPGPNNNNPIQPIIGCFDPAFVSVNSV